MRRIGLFLIGLALAGAAGPPVRAQQDGAETLVAVAATEQSMLDDTLVRYDALSRRQNDLQDEINLLRQALDQAVHEESSPDYRRVTQLAGQLERAEAERAGLLLSERLLVERVTVHLQRLELLQLQLDGLEARRDVDEGELTGTWEITLMPAQQHGSAALTQTGAVINGTYQLEGGWNGSLQGTLVNRKVFLMRIDSKLGKCMELEGYLSSDGDQIRGSWLNYELAGGEGATGQWSAQRRTESR